MNPMPNIFSRLLCAGLCLGGVTPAAVPTSGLVDAGQPSAATQPAMARGAPAPVVEDPHRWLAERLSDVGAGAAVARPPDEIRSAPPKRDVIAAMPYRTWLPPVVVPAKPRALPVKPQPLARIRPTADLPPLAMDLTPDLPGRVLLPATAPPRIESPDPAKAPLPRLAASAGELDRATAETDPTPRGVNPVLKTVPPARKSPAPPLLLSIPSPTREPSGSTLTVPHADDDPPVPSPGVPETPKLSHGK
jgi:hypothetical protein